MLKKMVSLLLAVTLLTGINFSVLGAVAGVVPPETFLQSVELSRTQITIEAQQGYFIAGGTLTLVDNTENTQVYLDISVNNRDVKGVNTNKIICSKLNLTIGHQYQVNFSDSFFMSNDRSSWNEYIGMSLFKRGIKLDPRRNFIDPDDANKIVDGLIQSVYLTATQLTVTAKDGYNFDGFDMYLKDLETGRQQTLGVWLTNPDVKGVLTNKIVYSNLHLTAGRDYELTISEGVIIDNGSGPYYTRNKKYITTLRAESPPVVEGSMTILSPMQTDYYIGRYINHYAIGNSVSPNSLGTSSGKTITNLASFEFAIPEFGLTSQIKDLARDIVVSDIEIRINGKLVQNRVNNEEDLASGKYLANMLYYWDDGIQFITLNVRVCEVAYGDKISVKIPDGSIYLPNKNYKNTAAEFTFNVLSLKEKLSKYSLYYRNSLRYPDIPPATIFDPPEAPNFSDVPETHWAYNQINQLVARGVFNGYNDGSFRPSAYVTRNEFAKMMAVALGIPLKNDNYSDFADVKADSWELPYVTAVMPYMTGYSEKGYYLFKGNEYALREDMATALVKALKAESYSPEANMTQGAIEAELRGCFSDYNDISPDLQKYILIAYKEHLIGGYLDGTFGPQKPITRAEAAALLIGVLGSDSMQKVTF